MAEKFGRAELDEYIRSAFEITSIPDTIRKQITKFITKQNFTSKEIARCICYFNEVERKTLDPIYGIWFVPNVREKASAYFKKLELDQQNQMAEARKVVEYQDNNIIINIKSFKHEKRKPKELNIEEIDINGIDH